MTISLSDLISRYEDDIRYLLESEDADGDDKIVAGVLTDVIGDLEHLDNRVL